MLTKQQYYAKISLFVIEIICKSSCLLKTQPKVG